MGDYRLCDRCEVSFTLWLIILIFGSSLQMLPRFPSTSFTPESFSQDTVLDFCFFPFVWLSTIVLITQFPSDSIMSGRGGMNLLVESCSPQSGSRKLLWNTSCMFHVGASSRRYKETPIFPTTLESQTSWGQVWEMLSWSECYSNPKVPDPLVAIPDLVCPVCHTTSLLDSRLVTSCHAGNSMCLSSVHQLGLGNPTCT